MSTASSMEGVAAQAVARRPATPTLIEPWLTPPWIEIWWRCLGSQPGRRLRPLPLQAENVVLPLIGLRRKGLRCLEGAGGESLRRDLHGGPKAWAAAAQQLAEATDWDWLDLGRLVQTTAPKAGALRSPRAASPSPKGRPICSAS